MMKNTRTILIAAAAAFPLFSTSVLAQDACQAAGQRVAAERGATLLAAEAKQANGQNVCEVVVLTPATDGGRPKREVVVVTR